MGAYMLLVSLGCIRKQSTRIKASLFLFILFLKLASRVARTTNLESIW